MARWVWTAVVAAVAATVGAGGVSVTSRESRYGGRRPVELDHRVEAHLSGRIVVRLDLGELPPARRRQVALALDCTDVGIAGDGHEC